jgi:hypothetical protein
MTDGDLWTFGMSVESNHSSSIIHLEHNAIGKK